MTVAIGLIVGTAKVCYNGSRVPIGGLSRGVTASGLPFPLHRQDTEKAEGISRGFWTPEAPWDEGKGHCEMRDLLQVP